MTKETDAVNPKDAFGMQKPPTLSVIPATAIFHLGQAMKDGARKYGPFNWRGVPVRSSVYVDAAFRHLTSWYDGERLAGDSGVHHLGHAMACLAILLDAEAQGTLGDDRPIPGAVPALLKELTET